MIKVFIVEDSPVVREIIKTILLNDGEFKIIGEAEAGEEAVDFIKHHSPDVITMDVNLKGKDGLFATKEIMSFKPTPIVIMSSLFNPKDEDHVFKALEAGAVEVFDKPRTLEDEKFEKYARRLIRELKILAGVRVLKRRRKFIPESSTKPESRKEVNLLEANRSGNVELVAIGASTGGPQMLKEIFRGLNKDFNIPIIVVQHIAEGFLENLINWLQKETLLPVKVAEEGSVASGGVIYFAPENRHLRIGKNKIFTLDDSPPKHSCKPSVSVLFESIASNCAEVSLAIILTGMGEDGAYEMKAIKENGGLVVAQDEESSLIFGMPRAAIEKGGVTSVLSITEIINLLNKIGAKNEG